MFVKREGQSGFVIKIAIRVAERCSLKSRPSQCQSVDVVNDRLHSLSSVCIRAYGGVLDVEKDLTLVLRGILWPVWNIEGGQIVADRACWRTKSR
jgi:hypothetical protein